MTDQVAASLLRSKMVTEQILKNRLDFVPARLPEATTVRPASYTVIRPDKARPSQPTSSESSGSESDNEDASEELTPASSPEEAAEESTEVQFYDVHEAIPVSATGKKKPKSRIVKSWNQLSTVPIGLENQGVTCYMNAAIQAMFHLPAMAHYLNDVYNGSFRGKIPNSSVTWELASLLRRLYEPGKRKSVYPIRIIRRLDDINCTMSEWQQEDSHEYFMSLMSRLQEDSTPKGQKLNTSIIHDIFGGSLTQQVTCKTCGHVSTTHQDFYDLPVSFSTREAKVAREAREAAASENKPSGNTPVVPTKFTLEGSIKDFFSPELIKPDAAAKSGYQCEKCKNLTLAVKVSQIEDAPEYLPVHIKRFKFQGSSSQKLKQTMKYPMELDLTKYSVDGQPIRYKLSTVIVHEGRTVSSGHYVAICRQPNNTWAEYDDDFVRRINEKAVLRQNSAYILIYSRLTPKPSTTSAAPKMKKSPASINVKALSQSPGQDSKKRQAISEDIDKIFASRKKNRVF